MVRGKSLAHYDVSNRNVVAVSSVVYHFLNSCEAHYRLSLKLLLVVTLPPSVCCLVQYSNYLLIE